MFVFHKETVPLCFSFYILFIMFVLKRKEKIFSIKETKKCIHSFAHL